MTSPEIRIVSKGATPEESAAVSAVLQSTLDELAASMGAEPGIAVSAWQRSQRSIRRPLRPGAGAWRSFTG